MNITIKLFGSLRKHMPAGVSGRVGEVAVPAGATVDDLAVQLGIEEVPAVVCINDQETHRARRLQPGDVVTFFPPLAGGVQMRNVECGVRNEKTSPIVHTY